MCVFIQKEKMKKTMTLLAALISVATAYSANPKQETLDTLRSYQLQDVQVVATRATKKTPMAFTNMSQEQIKRLNTGRDIPFLLATMPSVVTTSDAGNGMGYTAMRIRGTDASRINVTTNGIPMNDAESSLLYWVNMGDLASSLGSIQVQRGVGTSTNGAGAFGATVNMQTENIGLQPWAAFDLSGGSYYSHKQTVRFSTGLMGGHWGIQGRLSNLGSKGYVDRASSKLNSYFLQAGYFGETTVVKFITFNGVQQTYHAWDFASKYDQEQYGRTYNPSGKMEKDAAIDAQDFETAARLRDDVTRIQAQRAEKEEAWKQGDSDIPAVVGEEEIAVVLSSSTGIPVFKLTEEESARLLRMEQELGKRYIGQEDAVKALARSIRRTRAGLKDPKRPSGSFIFAGPSGVGKTELTKALTEFLFGDEDALITLDMSEYSEKHTASRMFGSPPGYVGYEEGGQLTEKVRRKPFSVVLFDEIEKAHPDIFNSLLQILDEGRLTDAQGRVVDFKNTVIVMTTNLGSRDISKGVNLGFSRAGDEASSYEKMKAKVSDELKQHFRPEFLNRVDEIVVFHQLTQSDIERIVDLMVAQIESRLADRDMGIELTPAAKTLVAKRGFDPVLGARPLRRALQRDIEDVLAEKILFGELAAGQIVQVDVAEEGAELPFKFTGISKTPPVLPAETGPSSE